MFHNTLLYLIPTEGLQMTAYDDYYPAVFYAVDKIPGSGNFIQSLHGVREDLREMLVQDNLNGFEKIVVDHVKELSVLKFLMTLPAKSYPQAMVSGIHTAPDQPLYHDLKTNTRGGSVVHNEGVEDFIAAVARMEAKTGYRYQPAAKQAAIPHLPGAISYGHKPEI